MNDVGELALEGLLCERLNSIIKTLHNTLLRIPQYPCVWFASNINYFSWRFCKFVYTLIHPLFGFTPLLLQPINN
jgi:hypothetical protein